MTNHKNKSASQSDINKYDQAPTRTESPTLNLPFDGMSRWNQIAPFSPFCREKFRQLVRAGRAPQPIRFSERCTAYSNQELHKFFADPLNYLAEGFTR